MTLFDADDDRLAITLDRRGSDHASLTAYNEMEEFAVWVPILVADATACNAFSRYTGGLRGLSASFETSGAWTETSAEGMRSFKTADLDVVMVPALHQERFGAIIECNPTRATKLELFTTLFHVVVAWVGKVHGPQGLQDAQRRFDVFAEAFVGLGPSRPERGVAPYLAFMTVEGPAAEAEQLADAFCTNCGASVDPGEQRFCSTCGTPLQSG